MRKINYTTTLNASEVDALRTIARKDFGGNVSAAMRAIIVTEAARRGLAVEGQSRQTSEGVQHV